MRLANEELDLASADDRDKLHAVDAQIQDTNRRLERLYDALETGKLQLEDLSSMRIQQHRDRLKQLQVTKWEIETRLSHGHMEPFDEKTVQHYVEDMRDVLTNSPLTERRSFVKSFVKEVKVTGKDVLLTYTIPMSRNRVLQEGVTVLDTVQDGGRLWIRTRDPSLIRTVL